MLCSKTRLSMLLLHSIVVWRDLPCYCAVRRLSTVESKKRRKAMKRRSTRTVRGDVILFGCVFSVWALCPNRRTGLGLNVFSVWPRSAFLFDTWISLTSAFDVQKSQASFCSNRKPLIEKATLWLMFSFLIIQQSEWMWHIIFELSGVIPWNHFSRKILLSPEGKLNVDITHQLHLFCRCNSFI